MMADPEGVGRKVAPEIGSHRLVVTPVWTECFGEHEHEANIWGCKRLGMPLTRWGGGWLEYGWFDKNGVWHFDKARIRHELEVRIHENRLCPVLLLAWALYLANWAALLGVALFMAYITRFQIIPEERALQRIFGKEYEAYRRSVRRWV